MYIINGIAYAGEPADMIGIENLKICEDRMLLLTFNNGEKKLFDCTLLTGPVYEPLKDDAVFMTAAVEDGAVIWLDGSIDCAPEFMYEHSYRYDEVFV